MGQPKLPLTYKRKMQTERVLRAGCYVCHGAKAYWTAANAQALAAQHHDRTTHTTWVDIRITTQYGRAAPDPRQIDIEDAIASSRNSTSSGDRPGSAPLPSPDAPAIPTADVSAPPKAALSKRALAAAKPEQTHV